MENYKPYKACDHLVKVTLQDEENICEFTVMIIGNIKGADVLKAAIEFDETQICQFLKGLIQLDDDYITITWQNGEELLIDYNELERYIVGLHIVDFQED